MITKMCARCKKPVPYPLRYCSACRDVMHKQIDDSRLQSNKKYNQTRDPESKAFYNSKEWETLKNYKLQQAGYKCEECGAMASEVHHIVPIKVNMMLRLVMENQLALCLKCHNKKPGHFGSTRGGRKSLNFSQENAMQEDYVAKTPR